MWRLPEASVPSADRAAALLLLASEAWVGVSRRLRTPPSTMLVGGLRAIWPKNNHPNSRNSREEQKKKKQEGKSGQEWGMRR